MAKKTQSSVRPRAGVGKKTSKKKPVKTDADNPPCACVPLAPQGTGKWQLVAIDGTITWENVTP